MTKPQRRNRLTAEPVLVDALRPELGGELVEAVLDDMARAHGARRRDRGGSPPAADPLPAASKRRRPRR